MQLKGDILVSSLEFRYAEVREFAYRWLFRIYDSYDEVDPGIFSAANTLLAYIDREKEQEENGH